MQHAGDDTWDIIGQRLRLHHSFWGEADDAYADCVVVGYIGAYAFGAAKRVSKHTYVIEYEGNHYPAPHSTVASALADARVRQRIGKAKPPKLIA